MPETTTSGHSQISPGTPVGAFWAEFRAAAAGVVDVHLEGDLTFGDASSFWTQLRARFKPTMREAVRFDLSHLDSIDGGAMALLVQAKWDLQTARVWCEFVGVAGTVKTILDLYDGNAAPASRLPRERVGPLAYVGNAAVSAWKEVQLALAFVGNMVLAIGGVARRPRTGNWRKIPSLMIRTGADAIPIVVLINFLIGFAMAFQAAVQLKQFGANIASSPNASHIARFLDHFEPLGVDTPDPGDGAAR